MKMIDATGLRSFMPTLIGLSFVFNIKGSAFDELGKPDVFGSNFRMMQNIDLTTFLPFVNLSLTKN